MADFFGGGIQQRDKLDAALPESICVAALSKHPGIVFEAKDMKRLYRFFVWNVRRSYLEIYQRFGGAYLEELLAFGSMEK